MEKEGQKLQHTFSIASQTGGNQKLYTSLPYKTVFNEQKKMFDSSELPNYRLMANLKGSIQLQDSMQFMHLSIIPSGS
jgi:hypothetical protein